MPSIPNSFEISPGRLSLESALISLLCLIESRGETPEALSAGIIAEKSVVIMTSTTLVMSRGIFTTSFISIDSAASYPPYRPKNIEKPSLNI